MNDEPIDIEGKSREELVDILSSYQRALELEKRYHATLDNMMEGFQMISFDWRYLYVNNTVVKQSKYSREELLGYTMMEKYPDIDKTPMFKALQECMTGRISKHFENEFTYPDGSTAWFELSIQPTREGLFILSMDITQRKRAEKQKLEYIKALEEMIFMTSHKVRQPVTQLMGISSLMEDLHKLSEEELKKIVRFMRESASSLDVFTKELTDFLHKLDIKTKEKDEKD